MAEIFFQESFVDPSVTSPDNPRRIRVIAWDDGEVQITDADDNFELYALPINALRRVVRAYEKDVCPPNDRQETSHVNSLR